MSEGLISVTMRLPEELHKIIGTLGSLLSGHKKCAFFTADCHADCTVFWRSLSSATDGDNQHFIKTIAMGVGTHFWIRGEGRGTVWDRNINYSGGGGGGGHWEHVPAFPPPPPP